MMNRNEIYLNITTSPICNMQDFRNVLYSSILDCFVNNYIVRSYIDVIVISNTATRRTSEA